MHDLCIVLICFCSKIIFYQKIFSLCWVKLDYPGSIVYLSCFVGLFSKKSWGFSNVWYKLTLYFLQKGAAQIAVKSFDIQSFYKKLEQKSNIASIQLLHLYNPKQSFDFFKKFENLPCTEYRGENLNINFFIRNLSKMRH